MDKKPKDLIYFDEAVEFPKELKAMEDKKLTPREMCVFALLSMGEGATVGDIMEAVDKYVLSLGVQSPAPDEKDENGLIDVPEPVGNFVFENAKGMMTSDGRYYHYSEVCSLLKRRDALKAQGDEFIAQRNHLQSLLRAEREKSAKLIEALEEIIYTYNNCGDLKNLTGVNHIGAVAKQSLAAYKGKEGVGNG